MFVSAGICSKIVKQVPYMLVKAMSTESLLNTSFTEGVKTITMCHQKSRNSLSINMMEHLVKEITDDQDNSNLRAIVIAAEGSVFSAGHNLKELAAECGRQQHEKVFSLSSRLMNTIMDCPVPVIACVDGLAAASGCQLVAQCDIAVCSDKSSFSTPGANFGLFCSTPGVALARCVPKMTAMHMLLTGFPLSSFEAKANGLVSKICPSEELDHEIDIVCRAIKSKSRPVIEMGKRFYYKQVQEDVRKAYYLGEFEMVHNINTKDGQEGIQSFIEKRKPIWN